MYIFNNAAYSNIRLCVCVLLLLDSSKLSNFVYEPSFEVDNVVRKLKPLLLLCSGTHEHMLELEPLLISSIKKNALKSGVDFIVSRTKIRNTNKYVTLSCAFRYT